MSIRNTKTNFECDLAAADRELWRSQDEFYSCMTKWIISRREAEGGRDCYELGLKYNDAIDRYFVRLEKEASTTDVIQARVVAAKLKSFLSTDLEYLFEFRFARRNHHQVARTDPALNVV